MGTQTRRLTSDRLQYSVPGSRNDEHTDRKHVISVVHKYLEKHSERKTEFTELCHRIDSHSRSQDAQTTSPIRERLERTVKRKSDAMTRASVPPSTISTRMRAPIRQDHAPGLELLSHAAAAKSGGSDHKEASDSAEETESSEGEDGRAAAPAKRQRRALGLAQQRSGDTESSLSEDDELDIGGLCRKRMHPDAVREIDDLSEHIAKHMAIPDKPRAKKLVALFGKVVGADGRQALRNLVVLLENHTHMDTSTRNAIGDAAPEDLVAAAVTAYRRHDAHGTAAVVNACMRNIRLAEFSRYVDALEVQARDKKSDIRRAIKAYGFVHDHKRVQTLIISYLLFVLDGLHPSTADGTMLKKRRKRLHAQLSQGRLFSDLWNRFGMGIFAFLPDSKYTTFRTWTHAEVKAAAEIFSERFPWIREMCGVVEHNILRPLICDGRDGRDVVRELCASPALWDGPPRAWDGEHMVPLLPPATLLSRRDGSVGESGECVFVPSTAPTVAGRTGM